MKGPTRLDRMIAAVSPSRGINRVKARAAFQAYSALFAGAGGHSGARSGKRSLRNWNPFAQSADADSVPDLQTLRGRTRDLYRNSPIATGAINKVVTASVGTGLALRAGINRDFLGLSEKVAAAWEETSESIWRVVSRQIDITTHQRMTELQDLVARSQLISGDLLVVRRFKRRPGDLLGLKLQIIEADRIATPPDKTSDKRIVEGVVRDGDGAPSGYWVRNGYPQMMYGVTSDPVEYALVPAFGRKSGERLALHLFDRSRPGQTRGIPYLAPVIEPLKQLERYTEAELAAAVISAFFTVFVTTETGEDGLANETLDSVDDTGEVDSKTRDLEMGPAMVLDLAKGENVTAANPARPNSDFDPFVRSVIVQIGIALEIPYEVLLSHFSSSFSAAKGAIIEAWRYFRARRDRVAGNFCDPVYEWVISESIDRGILDAPGFFDDPLIRRAYLGATWTGPSQGQIDPVKETKALGEARDRGWISDTEATAELRGRDYEDVVAHNARDRRTRRDHGEPDFLPPNSAAAAEPDDESKDGDKGGEGEET